MKKRLFGWRRRPVPPWLRRTRPGLEILEDRTVPTGPMDSVIGPPPPADPPDPFGEPPDDGIINVGPSGAADGTGGDSSPGGGLVAAPGANLRVGLSGNEPALAINPLNPNNVIVAQYNNAVQTMRISLDGGVTFPISRNGVLPAGQTGFDGDDSLAFDAQGRLFWTYLTTPGPIDVVSLQVNPSTGAQIGNAAFVATGNLDKEWLAADKNPSSPFANNLYSIWNDFNQTNAPLRFSRSTNQGASWTINAGNISGANEGFTWPSEVDVAPNGDVWVAWHTNTGGTNGGIRMRHSTDGGQTFGSEITPFPDGTAATTTNSSTGVTNKITGLHVWLQGSMQPRVVFDPVRPANIYVVAVNDPDTFDPTNDPSDIVLARSTDNGGSWTRSTISQGRYGDSEFMPAAGIDANGNLAVTFYTNARHQVLADTSLGGMHYLLDLFATTSTDGGLTFTAPGRINDASSPLDPQLGAPDRFGNFTFRIGEYNGLAVANGTAYADWTGNTATGQQIFFDKFPVTGSATAAYPTPLGPVAPEGSLVYDPGTKGLISFVNPVNNFTLNVSPGQTVTVLVTAASPGLQPSVQLLSPSSTVLGSVTAAAAGQNALLQTVPAAGGGVYTIQVSGAGGTTGFYSVQVTLNAAVENEGNLVGASNDTSATAQSLDGAFVGLQTSLTSGARAAVLGSLGGTVTVNATDAGWWDSTGAHTATNKNYFVGQSGNQYHDYFVFDLGGLAPGLLTGAQLRISNPSTGYSSPFASDVYTTFDESTPLASLMATGTGQTGIFNDLGSGTTYGSTIVSSASNGQTVATTLNAAALAALNGAIGGPIAVGGAITTLVGSNTQFLFANTGGASDSRQLVLTYSGTDYYSFTAAPGDTVTLALKILSGSGAGVFLEDGTGTVLASGVSGPGNLDQVISNFQLPAAGTYYVRVSGSQAATYSLVLTRNVAFDSDGTAAAAQNLAGNQGALGYVATNPGGNTVVPGALASTETFNGNSFPFFSGGMRYQQIYSASEFAAGGAINALRFRRSSGQGTFTSTPISVTITLGYSANSVATASGRFSDNIGPGTVTVYNGSLTLSSTSPNSLPQSFDVVVPLTSSFAYDPRLGDLLLDITVQSGPTNLFLATSALGQETTTTRIYNAGAASTTGTVGFIATDSRPYGLITRFDMAPAPDEDWYAVTLGAGQTALQLETSTPIPSSGLSPGIQLYDSTGTMLLASGTLLPDGINSSLLATGLTAGATYEVRVFTAGGTGGEYYLGVRSLLTPTPTQLVDNVSWGFRVVGPGWGLVNAGYGGSSRSHAGGGTGSNYAQWQYSGTFTAGTSYGIYVTWAPGAGNASNASYTVLDGAAVLSPGIVLNQKVSPNSAYVNGAYWQLLYTYTPATSGYHVITVRLPDNANGTVNADAVFDPPLATGGIPAAAPAEASDLPVSVGGAAVVTPALSALVVTVRPPAGVFDGAVGLALAGAAGPALPEVRTDAPVSRAASDGGPAPTAAGDGLLLSEAATVVDAYFAAVARGPVLDGPDWAQGLADADWLTGLAGAPA
jgi:hypothetical protein